MSYLKELIKKFGKEKVLEMALKVDRKFAENLERNDLHESIQQRAKLAQEAVDEMMKNPFTAEQAKEQVTRLNEQTGRRNHHDNLKKDGALRFA